MVRGARTRSGWRRYKEPITLACVVYVVFILGCGSDRNSESYRWAQYLVQSDSAAGVQSKFEREALIARCERTLVKIHARTTSNYEEISAATLNGKRLLVERGSGMTAVNLLDTLLATMPSPESGLASTIQFPSVVAAYTSRFRDDKEVFASDPAKDPPLPAGALDADCPEGGLRTLRLGKATARSGMRFREFVALDPGRKIYRNHVLDSAEGFFIAIDMPDRNRWYILAFKNPAGPQTPVEAYYLTCVLEVKGSLGSEGGFK